METKNNISIMTNLYNSLFVNRSVFLKNKELNVPVQFMKYDENRIFLRIDNHGYKHSRSAIYVRINDEIIYSSIKPISFNNTIYIFEPENIQILKAPRKEERKQIDQAEGNPEVYISNIISDFVLKNLLSDKKKLSERIRWEIEKKLTARFANVQIFFANDKPKDERLKFFFENRMPVYIPNSLDASSFAGDNQSMLFKDRVFDKEPIIKIKNYVSEVSIPLLYKGMIPFGYIQFNSEKPVLKEEFIFLRKFCASTSEFLSKENYLFQTSTDKLQVKDLSISGLSVVFTEKTLIKHFKDESLTCFNLFMTVSKQASLLCRVKNITFMENKKYKVGCSIENIDPIGEINFSEYLENLSPVS